ncbi:MAG: thiamine phosphate synthase [Chloroflexi bacterium]|nr:thiamine phosphate synthase [Chloroflexota bacterium]
MSLPCLALVTDRRLAGERTLEEVVARAVDGGVDLVQLREKDLPGGPLLALAQRLREVTRQRALLFVNERVDVALACGADGVQLGEKALPVAVARQLAGGSLLIGRSVHTVEGAVEAERQRADLVVVGTVFPSRSHPGGPVGGTELVRQVAAAVRAPVLGIGGILLGNAHQVIHAGAGGVAVVSAIMASRDPAQAARGLRQVLQDSWRLREAGQATA